VSLKAIKRLVEADALQMEIIPNPKVRLSSIKFHRLCWKILGSCHKDPPNCCFVLTVKPVSWFCFLISLGLGFPFFLFADTLSDLKFLSPYNDSLSMTISQCLYSSCRKLMVWRYYSLKQLQGLQFGWVLSVFGICTWKYVPEFSFVTCHHH
jgi:hypothetical protein